MVAALDAGSYLSEDAGRTWRGPLRAPEGDVLTDVVVHPAEPDTLYALDPVPYRFSSTPSPHGNAGQRDISVPPTVRVLRSVDAGEQWTEVEDYLFAEWLVPDPAVAGRLLAFSIDGTARTDDGGRSWRYATAADSGWYGIEDRGPVRRVASSLGDGRELFVGYGVLAWTSAGGTSWRIAVVRPNPSTWYPIDDAIVDPSDPGHLLDRRATRVVRGGRRGPVYLAGDGGRAARWNGAPAGSYGELALDAGVPGGVVAAGLEGLAVRSEGADWELRHGSGLAAVSSNALRAPHPAGAADRPVRRGRCPCLARRRDDLVA